MKVGSGHKAPSPHYYEKRFSLLMFSVKTYKNGVTFLENLSPKRYQGECSRKRQSHRSMDLACFKNGFTVMNF